MCRTWRIPKLVTSVLESLKLSPRGYRVLGSCPDGNRRKQDLHVGYRVASQSEAELSASRSRMAGS